MPENTSNGGGEISLVIGADGLPVIGYQYGGGTESAMGVAKCHDVNCNSRNRAIYTGVPDYHFNGPSLAIGSDGLPVISYNNRPRPSPTGGALRLAKCGDAACTPANMTANTVDNSAVGVGTYSSVAIGTDGFPVISYYDPTNKNLKLAKCADLDCASAVTYTHDNGGAANADVGSHTSIAIGADAFPVVSYYDATNGDLKVMKCVNAGCSASSYVVVDSTGDVGQDSSIAIGASGLPVISYYDATNKDLKVARCVDANCATPVTPTVVDDTGDVGEYSSLAIGADGLPVISYYDAGNENLKVAKCANADCTAKTLTTVDSANDVGKYSSIAIGADGLPVIAYRSNASGAGNNNLVKFVKCSTVSCRQP